MSPPPEPDPGRSPGPAPGPGQSPGPEPGPGQSPGPAPGPGQSPGPEPGPGQSPGPEPGPGRRPGPEPDPAVPNLQTFDKYHRKPQRLIKNPSEKSSESHDSAPNQKHTIFHLNSTKSETNERDEKLQLQTETKTESGSERDKKSELFDLNSSESEKRTTENPKIKQDDTSSATNKKSEQDTKKSQKPENSEAVFDVNSSNAKKEASSGLKSVPEDDDFPLKNSLIISESTATNEPEQNNPQKPTDPGSKQNPYGSESGAAPNQAFFPESSAAKEDKGSQFKPDEPDSKKLQKSGPKKASKSKLSDFNQTKSKQTAPKDENSCLKTQIHPESTSANELQEQNQPDRNKNKNSAPKCEVLDQISAESEKPDDAEFKNTAVTLDQYSAVPDPVKPGLARPRLRGYLLKRGGALKAWKQRWFVFDQNQNALVYFRTPRDATPLGKVLLSQATFTCEGAEPGLFYLHTPERTVTLKAQSEELKFFWLQQLQLKRWLHKLSPDSGFTQNQDQNQNQNQSNTGADLFPLLETVERVDTEETASRHLLLQLSLKHPLIELQNSVQNLRKRSSNEWSQSVFHVQAPLWTPPPGPKPSNQSAADTPTNQSAADTPTNQSAADTPTNQSAADTPTNQSAADTPTNQRAADTPTNQSAADTPTNQSAAEVSSSSNSAQAPPHEAETTPPVFPLAAAPQTPPPAGHVTLRKRSRSFLRRNTSSWNERNRLQQELQDQKDLVSVLQKALETCQSERRSWRRFLSEEDQVRLDWIRTLEDQVQDLRRQLNQTQVQLQDLKTSQNQKDRLIKDLQDQVQDLSEKNRVKQQVIMKLSDCVSRWTERSSVVDSLSVQTLVQQNQQLQDDLQAFQNQNQFLNSEIHQLSSLWRTSTETQRGLMAKVVLLEACNCELRGQNLKVLRQLQEVYRGDAAQSEAVQRLIEDTLKPDQNQVQVQVHRELDQYGFQLVPDFEVEDIKLLSKIQALELRSHNLNQEGLERPLVARWQQYMSSCRGNLSPSPELKTLIRAGVPPDLRPQIWTWIIRTRTQKDQDPKRYQQLCEQIESGSESGSRPWSRQIDLDLPRTLCTNQNFSSPSSPALQQLRRILLAFSWENPEIGYCQGLNRLAALVLLVLGSEEDSFWGLKAVVENIMPQDYYTPSLIASQADQLVLKDFLWEKLPRLAAHLDRCGVDVSMATFSWFLVAFVEILPSDLLLPLWDAFLYEGSKVLFRYSLALFKLKEAEILQLSSSVQIHQYLRVFTKTVSDHRKLASVAFSELNPFSRRALRNRRAVHLEHLQRELCDLQRQQSLFLSQRRDKSLEEDGEEEALDQHSDDED